MDLIKWAKMWDEKIRKWSIDPNLYFENDDIYKAYREVNENSKLIKFAIPEPYLGDVNSKCSAIILNLNPGQLLPGNEQVLPNGEFIKDGAVENYSEWARKWYYLTSTKNNFWLRRKKWADRLIEQTGLFPFGLELIPYHSKSWGRLFRNNNVLQYVENNVLLVAEAMLNKSVLKLILCMGNDYGYIFEQLKYCRVLSISYDNYSDFNIKWPINTKNDKPVNREYIVWKSPRGYYYLQTKSGAGFQTPPAQRFSDVEKRIIQIIDEGKY